VKSHDQRIDRSVPVSVCAVRACRRCPTNWPASALTSSLGRQSAQFVINAMSPAEVMSIVVDEDEHSMDLAIAEELLSQAIARRSELRLQPTDGWNLNS